MHSRLDYNNESRKPLGWEQPLFNMTHQKVGYTRKSPTLTLTKITSGAILDTHKKDNTGLVPQTILTSLKHPLSIYFVKIPLLSQFCQKAFCMNIPATNVNYSKKAISTFFSKYFFSKYLYDDSLVICQQTLYRLTHVEPDGQKYIWPFFTFVVDTRQMLFSRTDTSLNSWYCFKCIS